VGQTSASLGTGNCLVWMASLATGTWVAGARHLSCWGTDHPRFLVDKLLGTDTWGCWGSGTHVFQGTSCWGQTPEASPRTGNCVTGARHPCFCWGNTIGGDCRVLGVTGGGDWRNASMVWQIFITKMIEIDRQGGCSRSISMYTRESGQSSQFVAGV
jgi:hypothetical protein